MTPEQKLNEAHKLIQSGLYTDSIRILNELATSSQDFNISYLLGVAYQRTDNFILAEKYKTKTLKHKVTDVPTKTRSSWVKGYHRSYMDETLEFHSVMDY